MTPARTHTPICALPVADRAAVARRFLHKQVRVHLAVGEITAEGVVVAVARLWGYGNTRQKPEVLVLRTSSRRSIAVTLSRITNIEELH